MFSGKQQQTQRERLDRASQEVWRAVKLSETEANAAADAPHLYLSLRQRIAAEKQRLAAIENAGPWAKLRAAFLTLWQSSPWLVITATAAILLLAVMIPLWLREQAQIPQIVSAPPTPSPTSSEFQPAISSPPMTPQPTDAPPSHASNNNGAQLVKKRNNDRRRQGLIEASNTEVATDFIPLMYWPNRAVPEGGRIVRMRIPRAMLVSFGLPMNAARADEMVNAEVMMGDDGLARAIRFIH